MPSARPTWPGGHEDAGAPGGGSGRPWGYAGRPRGDARRPWSYARRPRWDARRARWDARRPRWDARRPRRDARRPPGPNAPTKPPNHDGDAGPRPLPQGLLPTTSEPTEPGKDSGAAGQDAPAAAAGRADGGPAGVGPRGARHD